MFEKGMVPEKQFFKQQTKTVVNASAIFEAVSKHVGCLHNVKGKSFLMGEYRNYPEDELRKGVQKGKYNKRSVG